MRLERNVFGILDHTAESAGGTRPAVGFEGRTCSFRDLRDRALRVATGLVRSGVEPGDRVAVMMGNRLEWVEILFALARIGAVCVPVNILLTGPEITHTCADSGATVLVVDDVATEAVSHVDFGFELTVTVGGAPAPSGAGSVEYESLAGHDPLPDSVPAPDLDDLFILYYSSGTTGLPKAAEHTHNGVLWNAAIQIVTLELTPDIRWAVIPSLSWAAGFHNLTLALIWIGGYSELRRLGAGSAENVVDFLVARDITHTMLVPSILRGLVGCPDLMERLDRSPLRWVVTGTEPVPRTVLEGCSRGMRDISLCQGYGLSEFPTITTVLRPDEVADHEGGAGRAVAFTTLAVRDDEGRIRREGRGELLIRSMASMRGYHNRPDQTAESFRDGWMHTGDLVELGSDGHVTIVGRTKDMIISGGLNVYPKEIEDVLHRIDGVAEAAVVGISDDQFGEAPVAVVVARDGLLDLELVAETCRARLASYKRPRRVLVRTEALPRNANSKLLKRDIRQWAVKQIASS